AAVVGVAMWKATGIVLRRSAAGWLQYRTQRDVRVRLIDHMLRLELSWYRRQSIGDLLAVTDSDAGQATFILAPLPYATGASLLLIGSAVLVAVVDPVMAIVAVAAIGLIASVDISGSWKTFSAFAEVQRHRGQVARAAHESFDGALTVKALGRESMETARFAERSEELCYHTARIGRIWNVYRVVVEGLLSIVTVLVLVVGAVRVRSGALTTGELVTIAYLFTLLFIPIRIIGFVIWDMAHSVAAWARVQAVFDAEDLVRYGTTAPLPERSGAEVAGDAVHFAYNEDAMVLDGVDLNIPPGRTVAVVGPTASGKSTLVTLLARLWDPTSGRISIDGRDLRDFARSALPGEVAFVAQDDFLFDDTVEGNIGFGADVSRDAIRDAAGLAGAAGFIAELPNGYDTLLGERGAMLSGGQRQRIALARALVRRPRLLILDDATSAVDPSVETRILHGLRDADFPSTVIVVAYRRSSLTLADEVVYIDDGRIAGHGSHDDMLAMPGYARLLEAYDEDARERSAGS
ncbi:MAG: ABC transporter ATP-binding protein, partial [Acidimicrobiia bacterium]